VQVQALPVQGRVPHGRDARLGVATRQEAHEARVAAAQALVIRARPHDLDADHAAVPGKGLLQPLLGHGRRQVANVHIARLWVRVAANVRRRHGGLLLLLLRVARAICEEEGPTGTRGGGGEAPAVAAGRE